MHDEVSDTENIRQNLAIERMIVEGCDILLDTSQTFVRQGEQIPPQHLSLLSINSVLDVLLTLCPSSPPTPPLPGSLIQLPSSSERGVLSKVRLGSLSLRKEGERQCFLFTKHLLICTRASGGKLHLLKVGLICPGVHMYI